MRLAMLAGLLFAALGCSSKPVEGEVVGKRHDPAHTSSRLIMLPNGSGGYNQTLTHDHVPDSWHLLVRCADGEVRSTAVSKAKFDATKEGDRYGRPKIKVE